MNSLSFFILSLHDLPFRSWVEEVVTRDVLALDLTGSFCWTGTFHRKACILPAVNVWSEGLVVIWFVGHNHGSDDRVLFRADVDHVEFDGVVFAVDGVL